MSNSMIQGQMQELAKFLEEAVSTWSHYLNASTVDSMLAEEPTASRAYLEAVASNVRRMLVYSEEGLDACAIVLNGKEFVKGAAEQTFYRVYHTVIMEFFSPKNDRWYEDSRSAYTGKNAIRFHEPVPQSLKATFRKLEGGFQQLREDLEFYETDYRTKMIQNK
ncbi:MAG: DUF3907 family protein [Bacilli bacterium]